MSLTGSTTLREVVTRVPNALRILTGLDIDIVENRTLGAACEAADVSLDDLLAVLEATEPARPIDPLVQHSIAALLHAHERVDGVLEGLLEVAAGANHTTGRHTPTEYARAAWRFVFGHTLPHLESEETYHFPLLARAGAPLEALYLLGEDHAVLRQLARRLAEGGVHEHATEISDEMVQLLKRFIAMFRWHAEREETILAEIIGAMATGATPGTTGAATDP